MDIYFICIHAYIHIHIPTLNEICRIDLAVTPSTALFQEFILSCQKDIYTFLHYIFYFNFFIISDMNGVKRC